MHISRPKQQMSFFSITMIYILRYVLFIFMIAVGVWHDPSSLEPVWSDYRPSGILRNNVFVNCDRNKGTRVTLYMYVRLVLSPKIESYSSQVRKDMQNCYEFCRWIFNQLLCIPMPTFILTFIPVHTYLYLLYPCILISITSCL